VWVCIGATSDWDALDQRTAVDEATQLISKTFWRNAEMPGYLR
jgi:hypothetical protein